MAGIVKSVERVTFVDFSGNSGTLTTNLTKGQVVGQCVVFKTWKANSNPANGNWDTLMQRVKVIDNGGTAAVEVSAADRTATPGYRSDVYVTVVEFDSAINVQTHTVAMADTEASDTITITDVGSQSSAFMLLDYYADMSTSNAEDAYCRWHFDGASTTSVVVERDSGGASGVIDGTLYVIDCDSGEFIVDHIEHTPATSDFSDDITISSTILADSFLISCYQSGEGNDHMRDSNWVAQLTTTTNINVARSQGTSGSTTDITFNLQVVEAQNSEFSVQRGEEVITGIAQTETITAVDLDFAMVHSLDHESKLTSTGRNNSTSSGEIDNMAVGVTFDSTTVIAFDHRNYRRQMNLPWEVIEWAEATAGSAGDIAATEGAHTAAFSGEVQTKSDLAATEAAHVAALAGSTAIGADLAATEAPHGARFVAVEPITNIYAQMFVRALEQGGETLTNFTGDNSIETPAFLPADAWDNYDPASFRASVRIGDVNFNHANDPPNSLALMRPKYSGHPNKTWGSKSDPGDSTFTAVMFSLEYTGALGFAVYEVGSDPSASTIGRFNSFITASIGDAGLGSDVQPDDGSGTPTWAGTGDGARRIYAFVVHTERDTQEEGADGNAVKNWWARFEFDTSGNVVQSEHGQTFLDTDDRITGGTPIDDLVDLAVTAITGTVESELFGWFYANYPHGYRGNFVNSQALHDQAAIAFDNWARGTKKIPDQWLDLVDRRNPANVAATQGAQTGAFAGGPEIAGDIAATEQPHGAAFTGGQPAGSTIDATEQPHTANLTGTLGRIGSISALEGAHIAAFAGTVRNPTGITAQQAPQTAAFVGTLGRIGSITALEAAHGASLAGRVIISSGLAATQLAQTGLFTGGIPIVAQITAVQALQTGRFVQTILPTTGLSFTGKLAGQSVEGELRGESHEGALRGESRQGRLEL